MTKIDTNKKVLHIITLFNVGGATENTIFTVAGLIKKGYKVEIITGSSSSVEGSMHEITERLKIPVHTFPNLRRKISPLWDLVITFQLFKFIKKNKFDIVHTHSAKAGVVGRIAAWLAKTPIVIHHNHGNPFHRFQNWFVHELFKSIEKFASLFCIKIVSVTYTIVDEMVANKIAPREKFVVIRSGFDVENFMNYDTTNNNNTREKYGLSENDIVLGNIGRLSVLKGHIYLLKAFEKVSMKLSNAKLVLVGDGEIKDELTKFISERNLSDKVIFTGLVWPKEIPSIISVLDVVVHTALLEGLPRVFAQSMLMGKPVIAFDLDGAHEVIVDGKNGYLIEPMNIDMLADRILDLISDISKARKFGEFAKNNISDDFSIQTMVDNTDRLYQELLLNSLRDRL
ncbi:MAG: glycosyltransferase family 4 protein [Bacteroidetes bacterium]|nr:glycosyltransferase family 4 protein [Bacteroidota bacterium]